MFLFLLNQCPCHCNASRLVALDYVQFMHPFKLYMIGYGYVSLLWKHLSYDFLLVAHNYVQFIYPLGMLIVYDWLWLCKSIKKEFEL